MANFSIRQLKFAVLEVLADRKGHRYNLLGGRGNQPGALEHRLSATFDSGDRQLADAAFTELLHAQLIQPTYDDLVEPGNWLVITEAGREALKRHALDDLDVALKAISPELVEQRDGAWSAIASARPDALRQAAHSARELLVQTLKLAAPDSEVRAQAGFVPHPKSGVTRRHRLKFIMKKRGAVSDSEVALAEKACELVEAAHDKLVAEAHSRTTPLLTDVHDALSVAEIALRRVLTSSR